MSDATKNTETTPTAQPTKGDVAGVGGTEVIEVAPARSVAPAVTVETPVERVSTLRRIAEFWLSPD